MNWKVVHTHVVDMKAYKLVVKVIVWSLSKVTQIYLYFEAAGLFKAKFHVEPL